MIKGMFQLKDENKLTTELGKCNSWLGKLDG
jgi:hypothetical protein